MSKFHLLAFIGGLPKAQQYLKTGSTLFCIRGVEFTRQDLLQAVDIHECKQANKKRG